jgi:hypothetical protein
MKLVDLHSSNNDLKVLNEFMSKLRTLRKNTVLLENSHDGLIQKAFEVGDFGNAKWVKKLMRGLKQVGVHGLNVIPEDERLVTIGEMKQILSALFKLMGKNNA